MKILNNYDLFLTLNNKLFEPDVGNISFYIKYSIWENVPIGVFIINDASGLLQEYFLTVPGTDLNISLGYNENYIEADMFIRNDPLMESDKPYVLGGDVELSLSHRWIKEQTPKNGSYTGTISTVVNQLSSHPQYKDFEISIDRTDKEDTWYQANRTDLEFIKSLVPYCKSRGSIGTPFFFFIDEANSLNLRSYRTLITKEVSQTLNYNPIGETEYKNNIASIGRKHKDFFENKPKSNSLFYYLDKTSGEFETRVSDLKMFSSEGANVPFKKLKTKQYTKINFLGKNLFPEDIDAEIIYSSRDILQQDKFVIRLPFNPLLKIGTPVNIKTYASSKGESIPSTLSQYSGKFLIEESIHMYDGFNQKVLTTLIVSRVDVKLFEKYILKSDLT